MWEGEGREERATGVIGRADWGKGGNSIGEAAKQ